jgi:hypothetical protein
MPKKDRPGLPPGFDLNLPKSKPVELGDYLDEADEQRRRGPDEGGGPVEHSESGERRAAFLSSSGPVPAPVPVAPVYPQQRGYLSRQQLRPGAVPRKQMNLSPDTLRMLDDMLHQIRQQSVEKDVRMSELFHAMVLCVHEARAYMDLSGVPPRGRWGSPTAAALPVALKNAFMDAISRARPRR